MRSLDLGRSCWVRQLRDVRARQEDETMRNIELLMDDPRPAAAERGISMAPEVEISVVENTLSDEQLEGAVGGSRTGPFADGLVLDAVSPRDPASGLPTGK